MRDFCLGHGKDLVLGDNDRFEGVGYALVARVYEWGILLYFEFSGQCLCSLFYRQMKPVVLGAEKCEIKWSGEIFALGIQELRTCDFYIRS